MKLNLKRTEIIAEGLREGLSPHGVCIEAGIDYSTYYIWRSKGYKILKNYKDYEYDELEAQIEKERDWLYVNFYIETEKAIAHWENSEVRDLKKLSKKTWQIRCWFLERRRPEQWGRKKSLDFEEELEMEVTQLRSASTEEEKQARKDRIMELLEQEDGRDD